VGRVEQTFNEQRHKNVLFNHPQKQLFLFFCLVQIDIAAKKSLVHR
jgi:hypothetical protein